MSDQSDPASTIIGILKASGGEWLKRGDIAEKLGKKRLDPGSAAILDTLAGVGVIERRKVDSNAPVGYRWEYRAK